MRIVVFIITLGWVSTFCTPAANEVSEPAVKMEVVLAPEVAAGKDLFEANCSGCHGVKVQAFADQRWKHGNSPEEIAATIREGRAEGAMPSFAAMLDSMAIQNLVAYIQYGINQVGEYDFEDEFDYDTIHSHLGQAFTLELVTEAAEVPWGMAFLPTGALLVTDRNGKIFKIEGQEAIELKNVPQVNSKNQGGMLDIVLDPEFASNQLVYVSYSKVHPEDAELTTTAVSRYVLTENGLEDAVEIFEATPYESTNHHFGSRLVFGDDGYLYITVGDRGKRDDNPQDLTRSPGKVHRIKSDGTIPDDNPFVADPNAVASIYSYGHRNPQGMIKDPATGNMWAHEHGPRGGDEINEIVAGNNYGWPVISYGINYNGTVFTTETEREGMEQPKHYWVPSIGPSGMAYVTSERYPNWKNHLLSGSLKYGFVSVMPLRGGSLGDETRLLEGVGRTRSIVQSPDGYLYIGLERPGRVYKIVPVSE